MPDQRGAQTLRKVRQGNGCQYKDAVVTRKAATPGQPEYPEQPSDPRPCSEKKHTIPASPAVALSINRQLFITGIITGAEHGKTADAHAFR